MKHISLLSFVLLFFAGSLSAQAPTSSKSAANNTFRPASPYYQEAWDQVRSRNIPTAIQDSIISYCIAEKGGSGRMSLGEALLFLYAYMPQSDLYDYDFSFFKQQATVALEGRKVFPWGASVPEDLFRHFVLVYRVNNENLDTARSYIFHQLQQRVKGLSMYEAALEVNHWCHEYVDYQPSDVRTSAPLATLRTSHGRCGEESTLTVTAMRAVGIPARQCYTPRWAHCDDNHAWVEVWVDGQWRYLGACEPDPELNMGWFSVPASRTMMVHTNVFGRYNGPEEVNKRTPYYSCINVLPNYAATTTLQVRVIDENGTPVPDATVRFQLYNYAEYYTLAQRTTGEDGLATLVTGKGDLLIWANKGEAFNFAKMDGRVQNSLTLVLPGKIDDSTPLLGGMPDGHIELIDICPPVGGTKIQTATPERTALNDRRKKYEDSLREAYRHTFPTPETLAKDNLHNDYFTDEELYDIIRRSEGNYREIIAFLSKHAQKNDKYLIHEYVDALADKDLRDASALTLESNLIAYQEGKFPKDVFVKGLLSVRISNEMLRPANKELLKGTYDQIGLDPTVEKLRQYTLDNIVLDSECNYYNCPISPKGVLMGKRADAHSLGIFFVKLCRTYGVPAFMDNSNGALYAWEGNEWQNVTLTPQENSNGQSATAMGTLVLHNPEKYAYYPQYTLQRWEDGQYVSYDFENDPRVDKTHIVLPLPAGKYCLSTGSRYSNGDVLSRLEFFDLKAGQSLDKNITLRPLVDRPNDYGRIDVDQTYVNGISLQQWMSKSGKQKVILCLVTPGTEPVNHLMKEIATRQQEYEQWNGPLLFVAQNASWKAEKGQPKNLTFSSEGYDKLMETILRGLVTSKEGHNPVCVVIDQNGTLTFFSEGYHIGLGELLINNATK